uniref:DUF7703 domain-containing protein n=1 Tax=Fusarium oxysporum (strain Fo5176) TaxID=660025 RepID=A0A0D2YBU4_FUSOF
MAAESGETGQTGPIVASLLVNMVIAGLFAIACYNCLEIIISLLNRFKRHDGLYFWSMVSSSSEATPNTRPTSSEPSTSTSAFNWPASASKKQSSQAYTSGNVAGPQTDLRRGQEMERKIMRYLIIVNILVILLDISLILTQYMSHFNIQTTYKPVVYSIKLKMEFVVLNKLLLLVQHSDCNCMHVVGEPETPPPDPSHIECQSIERNSSTRTGSDVPIQMNVAPIQMNHVQQYDTNASSQSGGRHQKANPLHFLDYSLQTATEARPSPLL